MTIGIYGRGLANRAGIGRYTRELLRSLFELPTDHRFLVFVGEATAREHADLLGDRAIVLGGGGDRIVEEQIALPRALRKHRIDLFHNPDFTLPFLLPRSIPALVTVHDVAYARLPDSNSLKSKLLLKSLVPFSIQRARAVITVSRFSRSEIVGLYPISPEKIQVIPNGIESRFMPPGMEQIEAIRRRYELPSERVVLYLGGIEPRKNLGRLAEAVAKIPHATLAIAGGQNRNAEAILQEVQTHLGERLRLLGFVPDDDLPALYGAATVFAYPSLYEGFGIPPLEAMACGTPVVTSSVSSLPEAVGDAATLVDPTNADAIAEGIRELLDNDRLRRSRIKPGIEQAKSFAWPNIAAQTMALYDTVARSV